MAIDTSAVTSVITAFKGETREGSISPSRLGSLLQSIVNLFSNCAPEGSSSGSTPASVTVSIGLTKESLLDDDDNELGIKLTSTVTVNGTRDSKSVTIPMASLQEMGLMSSADKSKLDGLPVRSVLDQGLITAEERRTIGVLSDVVDELSDRVDRQDTVINDLKGQVQTLQEFVANLDQYYVRKSQLTVVPNPTEITIPITQTSSGGGRITTSINQNIYLTAYDEREQEVDVADCTISWELEDHSVEDVFLVEHETEKRYVTLMANAGDDWYSSTGITKLKLKLTYPATNAKGETDVILKRVYS